jgi:hypothetical protein
MSCTPGCGHWSATKKKGAESSRAHSISHNLSKMWADILAKAQPVHKDRMVRLPYQAVVNGLKQQAHPTAGLMVIQQQTKLRKRKATEPHPIQVDPEVDPTRSKRCTPSPLLPSRPPPSSHYTNITAFSLSARFLF